MTLTPIDKQTLACDDSGKKLLGFITNIEARSFRGADTVAIKKSEGMVIDSGGRVSPWPIERFIEHEGVMVALGPWIADSRPFEEKTTDARSIAKLLSAVRALKAVGFPLGGLFTPAFRWLPDDGVLVMPAKLASWIRETSPETMLASAWEPWVHPDRSGEDAWSFSIGVMAWKALTGEDPFAEESGEARRERIRRRVLPPIHAAVPGVKDQAADIIRRALVGPDSAIPSLDEWEALLVHWIDGGIVAELRDDTAEELRQKASKRAQLLEDRLRMRRWLRKSGWKYAGVLILIVGVAAIVSAPIGKMLEEPITVGMTPMEVASTYYSAIDSLDSESMDDCVAKNVGKADQRQVDMIFVTGKVRQGYEGLGEQPRASDWLASNRPELPEGVWPWGITNLKLTDLGDGRIEATYLFWGPPESEDDREPKGIPRRDILTFEKGRKSWEITAIDRSMEG